MYLKMYICIFLVIKRNVLFYLNKNLKLLFFNGCFRYFLSSHQRPISKSITLNNIYIFKKKTVYSSDR